MDNSDANTYSFNGQDYSFTLRLWNGINDVYLTNTAWDDLYLEDNILDFFMRGTLIINSPYDSLERTSAEAEAILGTDKTKITYKFRNDGRDTLYIAIKPKQDSLTDTSSSNIKFDDEKWLIELEMVIYDVQDLPSTNVTDKRKKIFFWEKTYQMMTELDTEFSTANVGPNANKQSQDQANDFNRSLPTGIAIAELLKSDELFKQHAKLTDDKDSWDTGDTENVIFYTSPNNSKFINDLQYLVENHVASADENYQPCILKLERSKTKGKPKQFSLKSFQKYFKKAGKSEPGDYQIEHFFIEEHSDNDKAPPIKKAPLSTSQDKEIKAEQYNFIKNYSLVDFSGIDYAQNMANRNVISYNSMNRQFNIDSINNVAEVWKDFFGKYIKPNILTSNSSDRLPITPYIKDGKSTHTVYSVRPNDNGRLTDGKNKIIKYFLFSNLGISFTARGLTIRQSGRFFGLSKQSLNDKEYDHKLEGQYFVTNVRHYFSNTQRGYYTELTGVKTHTYKEDIVIPQDDALLITG